MPNILNRGEQHCAVCGQLLDEERQTLDAQEIAFVGAAAYAWCPGCGGQVPQPWDAAYKVRWANAFADWCRSQRMRARRQPPTTIVRLLSPGERVIEIALVATEAGYEVRSLQDGELQAVERFASRESGRMRLQELEQTLRSQSYRRPGEPREPARSTDNRPTDLWTTTLPDGRLARAMLIPTGSTVSLVLYVDDKVQDIHDYGDLNAALQKAGELRLALIAGRRKS